MFQLVRSALVASALMAVLFATSAFGGAIYTTDKTGTVVNANTQYGFSTDVYLSGGPQNTKAAGLPDGAYYFQVTDPSGKTLLSTDNAECRQFMVVGGRVVGSTGPSCQHANGVFNPANGTTPVQLAPFATTANPGNVYKAWAVLASAATISASDPKVLVFNRKDAKTDNFKVPPGTIVTGSCAPSSSLSVLAQGTNVTAYVPKGSWFYGTTGVSVVNVEGSSITPTLIPTPNIVNSCASNGLTGTTVCSANNTDVYLLSGTTLNSTLTSSGSGVVCFSGGCATNTGVAMDATHNKAVVALSLGGVGGFQFLNLATSTFEPAFPSQAPSGAFFSATSEDILIDPIRNRLLSASENNNYEIIDVTTSTSPAFYENAITIASGAILDSSGEDCSTQIALAPAEFSAPSVVYLADITTPPAVFTAGSPGTWTAPSQAQTLSESFLSAGASGIAVAQGTHIGIVSGEFGGDAITAIVLPSTSGTGATPAITDWVSCSIGNGFNNGFDPHTVTAYQSLASGDAIAVLANSNSSSTADTLAVVDLTQMLNPTVMPRTAGGHACASGTLPATVVRFIAVP